MIETFSLSKVYDKGITALSGITTTINDRLTAIIGRNGAGKTTFSRIVSTQLEPTSGSAIIDGLDILRDARRIRKRIVSIPQEASPISVLTPLEQVKLYLVGRGLSIKEGHAETIRVLDAMNMRDFKNSPADTLSGGMKRKIFVCMAIASNADIVFLDEPTTGLDPVSRMEVWSSLGELSGEVILTTHYMEEAQELADRVILFERGRIIEDGTVENLLSKFRGKVRVECPQLDDYDYRIGNRVIKYVNRKEANEYIGLGCKVKPITLDDIFLSHGVQLEY